MKDGVTRETIHLRTSDQSAEWCLRTGSLTKSATLIGSAGESRLEEADRRDSRGIQGGVDVSFVPLYGTS